ncbi:hypothetical protein EJB05_06453 [Eragrostis curvula]|uniref:NAC domain-containing protein n=1 Tax=Eragrostis curvula TaxID=38414 RepID=A0A5J9WFQ9_9POAL|nr:hypothetical protein EJB05_06453 [Eragrostis curvula]
METSDEAAATASDASAPAIVASGSTAGYCSSFAAAASPGSAAAAAAFVGFKFVLNLPPGYHFVPTDAELIVNFLRPRLENQKLPLPIFNDERILDYHPEQLIEKYRMYGEDRWFFFTRRERKHAGGKRPNRTTPGNGHWNATGSQRPIYSGGVLVGCVGTLVFYEASRKKKKEDASAVGAEPASPDEDSNGKTDWTMYEYESLTSEAEFEAKRNGEGKIEELVLCTIQKKKHCEQSKEGEEEKGKKKRKRKEDEEGIPSDGSCEKKGRGVGRKRKDQESSHDSGSTEEKSRGANGSNKTKGGRTKGRSRKELAQEQAAYVKRCLMATPQQELMQVPLGGETVNTDPNMNMSHGSVTTSTMPLSSSQKMMPVPAAGTQSNSVHPNYMVDHNFMQPMETLLLQAPTLRERFPYEQTFYYSQQINSMAPPEVYNSGLGPGYSYNEYDNANHLLGIDMDYYHLQSFQFPAQPSYGIGGSTSMQGAFSRSLGINSVDLKPKY